MDDPFKSDDTARLPTRLWVDALRRRAEAAGAFATVLHSGDQDRGDVLIKVVSGRLVRALYAREFGLDGSRQFANVLEASAGEFEATELIERRRGRDPDLWVIEIDDLEGRHFLTEPVQ